MFNFGVVGTNWISGSFLGACKQVEGVSVSAVFSRKHETARKFADTYGIDKCYTEYSEMLNDDLISAVYIAAPNSLHFNYAKEAMLKGKHVLCEKPFTSNLQELEELIQISIEQNVLLMEGMKVLFLPSYHAIREGLERIGKVRMVNFQKFQYSSRYDDYKAGALPNVFNPEFSTGAAMDLGVYTIYACLDLFGTPLTFNSVGALLESGVDGSGTSILKYEDFTATLSFSKITNSNLPSEILGEEGSLLIDSITSPTEVKFVGIDGTKEILYKDLPHHSMSYQVREFVECVKEGKIESSILNHELAKNVMKMLDDIRKQMNVTLNK